MILAARRGAGVIPFTISDTLVRPFATDKERQCQGVLGDIGFLIVSAQATICKSFLGNNKLVETEYWENFEGSLCIQHHNR